jgi:hypothetical protein
MAARLNPGSWLSVITRNSIEVARSPGIPITQSSIREFA